MGTSEIGDMLATCIRLDSERKQAKKALEDIETEFDLVKERVKDAYIEMGVTSMRSGKKNVYLARQLWAGLDENVEKGNLADVLKEMNMADYISCNLMKLSSYVRELAKDNPDFVNLDGDIIAEAEDIVAALPEPLNRMVKVTEKIDIRVRN